MTSESTADGVWRPTRWREPPPTGDRPSWIPELAVVLVAALYNVAENLWVSGALAVPLGLAGTAIVLVIARSAGVTWDQLGLARHRAARGLAIGSIVSAAILAGIVVGVALPWLRPLFEVDGVAEASTFERFYRPLVRIPFGTALFEEVLFRGVLLALFLRRASPIVAATASSLLFGCWHVLPAVVSIDESTFLAGVTGSTAGLTVVVAGVVIATGLAGLAFCWLRFLGNSVIAPCVVHAAANSLAYVGALAVASF